MSFLDFSTGMIYYGLIVDDECKSVIPWWPQYAKKTGRTEEPQLHEFSSGHDPDIPFEIKELNISWD